jgi:hypothetical protein
MRTWGRDYPTDGSPPTWTEVGPASNGQNDPIWITTLAQCLLLNLGESPMYGNYGIPAQQSVNSQIPPDYYVSITQSQFAPFFASLIIRKRPGVVNPTYDIALVTNTGVSLPSTVAVPI